MQTLDTQTRTCTHRNLLAYNCTINGTSAHFFLFSIFIATLLDFSCLTYRNGVIRSNCTVMFRFIPPINCKGNKIQSVFNCTCTCAYLFPVPVCTKCQSITFCYRFFFLLLYIFPPSSFDRFVLFLLVTFIVHRCTHF